MTPAAIDSCLYAWRETAGGRATLINLSENHTFRIDTPDGERFILRLHRPGYQSVASIRSELDWLLALRWETAVPIPRPLPGRDGQLVQLLGPEGETGRLAVLFAFEEGREPAPSDDLGGLFETLGGYAAALHLHAGDYRKASVDRQVWSVGAVLDPDGLWGDWRAAPYVESGMAETLAALDRRLRTDLAVYGTGADRFGLIHADMRLANLLVDGDRVTLIDFDDCGFCWFMYDFAAAISFHEMSPAVAEWRRRWLAGYLAVRQLSAADLAIIDTMIMLRRMALLAWIGSHAETDLARSQAPRFAADTARLAAAYLAGKALV